MNALYFFYTLLKTDYKKYRYFASRAKATHGLSFLDLAGDSLMCLMKYDTFLLDYFHLKFYSKDHAARSKHASRLDMYRFQKQYNMESYRDIFRDKRRFHVEFSRYMPYGYLVIEAQGFAQFVSWVKAGGYTRIVAKNPCGQVGVGVLIGEVSQSDGEIFIDSQPAQVFFDRAIKTGATLIEEYIFQHSVLMDINPKCLNTIRVITVVRGGVAELVATILRTSYDKKVDNFDAGGISASIDIETGIVSGPAVVKDPFREGSFDIHPISGGRITGVQMPFWEDLKKMVLEAALVIPQVRTVGWDAVITPEGPALIEGNDNWDKTHWEICERQGFKQKVIEWMRSS